MGFRIMTGRFYKIDGERYPSVTTILRVLNNPGLAQWRGSVGNTEADRIGREAASYGTDIHALVEIVNRDNRRALGHGAREIVQPYIDWLDEHVGCVIAAERLCISRRYRYAGTADAVVMMNGDSDATIVDLKTSKTDLSQREWALQLAAYALALAEEDIECRRRIIVRMPRAEPGKLYVLEIPDDELEVDQRAFLACLRLFQWHEERGPVRKPLGPRIRFGAKP